MSRPGRRQTFVESWRAQGYHTFGAGKVFHGVFDYAEAGATASRAAAWREFANRAEVWDGFAPNTTEPLPPHEPRSEDLHEPARVHVSDASADYGDDEDAHDGILPVIRPCHAHHHRSHLT